MKIENNMVVGLEYSLIDANTKEQLDSNVGHGALEFITGKSQIIPGLESKLMGLEEGTKTDVMVDPKDGYGEIQEEGYQTLPKEQFAGIDLVEGMTLYGTGENGDTIQVKVKSVQENDVTIDYNHPLAGRTLMFSVTIASVRAATEEEISMGVVGGAAAAGGCCGGGSCGSHDHDHSHDHGEGCCSTEEPKKEEQNSGCCGGGHCS